MLAMRHSSAPASMNYQQRNMTSEENRLLCLGFKPPSPSAGHTSQTQLARLPSESEDVDEDSDEDWVDLQQKISPKRSFKSEPVFLSQQPPIQLNSPIFLKTLRAKVLILMFKNFKTYLPRKLRSI